MNMIDINFNNPRSSEHRFYLCKPTPTRDTVAEITPHITEADITEQFGHVNELNLSIPYNITKNNGEIIHNPTIDKLFGNYLVRYDFQGVIKDYYIITDTNDEMSEDGSKHAHIVCYQLQYELKDKLVRAFKGTYQLYDPLGNGVLNLTLLAKTNNTWTVDYIDGTLFGKFRTFDTSEQDLLQFTLESIQAYGNYVPIFNTVNKTISIYLIENASSDLGVQIEYGNYLKSIQSQGQFNEIATRIYAYGNGGLTFRSLNASGADYVENITYYMLGYSEDANGNVLTHSPYMTDGLVKAEKSYQALIVSKTPTFQGYLAQKEALQGTLAIRENEMATLQTEMNVLLDTKDVLIETGGSLTTINGQIASKQSQINAKQSEINGVNTQIASVDTQIAQLRNEISLQNNFTTAQLNERNYFIKERVWEDSNYNSSQDLYDQALIMLSQWAQPTYVYSCNIIDLLNRLGNDYDSKRLKNGSILTLRFPEFDIDVKMTIITTRHNILSNDLSVTLANSTSLKTGLLKYTDLLQKSAYSSTTINQNKFGWDMAQGTNTEFQQYINGAIDANKQMIEGGTDLQYLLDTRGLTIKSKVDPTKYLRAVNSCLAITNDNGITWKNAITYKGIIAEQVVGQLIAGANLVIQNEAGTVQIDNNGLTVTDMDMTITRSDVKSRVKINATDGFKIQKNTGTSGSPVWGDQISLDTNGNAIFAGTIQSATMIGGSITIGSGNSVFRVDTNGNMWLGSTTFNSAPFRVTPQGNVTANSFTATSATINSSTWTDGTFTGNVTVGGTLFGGSIIGASILSNSTINVTTDANIGNRIFLNTVQSGVANGIIFGNSGGIINLNSSNAMSIGAANNIHLTPNSGMGTVTVTGSLSISNSLFVGSTNILSALNTKATAGASTGFGGGALRDGGIEIGADIMIAGGGTMRWQGISIPSHTHTQN